MLASIIAAAALPASSPAIQMPESRPDILPCAGLACASYPAPDWKDEPDPIASPRARKGGILRFWGGSSPKSFNAYIDNNSYTMMMFAMMYGSLIVTDTETLDFAPHLARRWWVSDDGTTFEFEIDADAKWSDGFPVTADDVKWTFDVILDPKSDTGSWKTILGCFESPVIVDAGAERTRRIRFTKRRFGDKPVEKNWRDLMYCGTFNIMPKHAFEGQDFNKIDLVGAPVCGPYMIARTEEWVATEYEREKNWWRKDLPSCRHVYNFDKIKMNYIAESENAFAALKHDRMDIMRVSSARQMALETDGPKFVRNWIVKRRVRNHNPVGYQAFAMNMRRPPFKDIRVRKAMAMLLDREFMNRSMMFNEYFLQRSFYGSLYDESHPCTNPLYLYDFEGAKRLLEEAGCRQNADGVMIMKDGKPFRFTFLSRSMTEDRFLSQFDAQMKKLGIEMTIDRTDFAGWMKKMDSFDFDMTWQSLVASLFPNPEIAWLSSEADRKQSNNTVGFKSAEVDRLIAEEKTMTRMADREETYRKIDKLVTAECPVAFLWNTVETRLLYWNRFGMPDTVLSRYDDEASTLAYWWYDPDRAAELDSAIAGDKYLPKLPVVVDFDEIMKKRKAK